MTFYASYFLYISFVENLRMDDCTYKTSANTPKKFILLLQNLLFNAAYHVPVNAKKLYRMSHFKAAVPRCMACQGPVGVPGMAGRMFLMRAKQWPRDTDERCIDLKTKPSLLSIRSLYGHPTTYSEPLHPRIPRRQCTSISSRISR